MWIVALIVLAGVVTTIINRALPLRARLRRHRSKGGVAGPCFSSCLCALKQNVPYYLSGLGTVTPSIRLQ